jgi:DNA-binding transcriptional MerR regulator
MNHAAVSIPEKLFFKIGEVCDITGVQAHVLRYWESEFPMLAPQKNRAGQRTYRKRDVEMVLRIKELLYEDQYTIAGAKKKLTNDLRGASKLKVVTPEMSAQTASAPQTPQLVPQAQPTEETPDAYADTHEDSNQSVFQREEASAAPSSQERPHAEEHTLTDERRAALRRIREQLRDLLVLLESDTHTTRAPRR